MSDTPQIDNWSEKLDERKVIEDFWEFLMSKFASVQVIDIHPDKAIDEYHGVDRRELDKERRELLRQQRQDQEEMSRPKPDPKDPFKGVPEGACPNCRAVGTLKDTSAFLVESCECTACGWKDAHSGGCA